MINALLKFDFLMNQFINELIPHNHLFNLFFSFFSLKTSSLPIWLAIIILLVIFEEKIDKKFILYFLISLAVTGIIVFGLKNTVKRPRPPTLTSEVRVTGCGKDFSFPSGHASIAFASATILAAFDKKRRWFYYAIAILISLSRLYLQCHYFLDLITGAILGLAVSEIILSFHFTFPPRRI